MLTEDERMDLLNKRVKHVKNGIGSIVQFDGAYLTVQFETRVMPFVYPDAFEKFLVMEDAQTQKAIVALIESKKTEEIERQRIKETARIEAEKKREEQVRASSIGKRSVGDKKDYLPVKREPGKARIFYVFQKTKYEEQRDGGYIWAPKLSKAGRPVFHWDRLKDVREGDVILHGCHGYIKAVSIAKGSYYSCEQPEALRTEEQWELEGRKVDCEYISIQKPIKASDYREYIKEMSKGKYEPFDKDGNGNMGYLFDINPMLAKLFISESAKKNSNLLEYDFVKKILEKG